MRVIFALAATAATASAVSVTRSPLALGWESSITNLAGDYIVDAADDFAFHVVVRDQNIEQLKDYVDTISDPTHPNYGQSMTTEEVSDFTKPLEADTKAVTAWLDAAAGCTYTVDDAGRHVRATCSVSATEELFQTEIEHLVNKEFNQEVIRAGDYVVPDEVDAAAAAIFGLHGLPRPPLGPLVGKSAPGEPADVTPAVLAQTYSISGVTPKGTDTNRMAVAEFQNQNEKDSDLAEFFKKFVPHAQQGDEKISKFVGDKDQQQAGVEASLDIQYIMGVAPHIKAEFWLFDPNDFCADLEKWTGMILSDKDGPNVHSVSYGWQGDLDQLQCTPAKYNVVDNNFAKIAATRASIIFASGDSGSGYAPPQPDCNKVTKDVVNVGKVVRTEPVQNAMECCEISASEAGYSFTSGSAPPSPGPKCSATDYGKKDESYKGKAVQQLRIPAAEPEICCEIARRSPPLKPYYFTLGPKEGTYRNCSLYTAVSGMVKSPGSFAGQPAQEVAGNCTIFSTVTGTKPSPGTQSGSSAAPSSVTLYPSWPASSPYVTSVGATRFVNQKAGEPEMASDQFGSGGGFSDMFNQTDHATWQTEAVKEYTSNPPADPHYPPAGSFNPKGRATPDICALGEGYQVVTEGSVQPVGGTSASTPAFAGMLALINEAREQAGKPAMGLLNAFLYQNADCFTDVTLGTNAIGRGTGPIKYGFNATKGWDPATGLGSPIFNKLLAAALKA